ncbi:MAG: hypothetical protein LAT52_12610 [Balneolales bacterium]|nr:hypothetical protein [Balneolales bacterium]
MKKVKAFFLLIAAFTAASTNWAVAQEWEYDIIEWNDFEIRSQSGQLLKPILSDFRMYLPQPDEETQEWNEFFGMHTYLTYGSNAFSFVDDFGLYLISIKDNMFYVVLSGIAVRVGHPIHELAEHVPKSWSKRVIDSTDTSLSRMYVTVGDDGLSIVFDHTTGLIKGIYYVGRLT